MSFKSNDLSGIPLSEIIANDIENFCRFYQNYLKGLTSAYLQKRLGELGVRVNGIDFLDGPCCNVRAMYRGDYIDSGISESLQDAYRKLVSMALNYERLTKETDD